MPTPSIPLRHNEPRKTVFPRNPSAAHSAARPTRFEGVTGKSGHFQPGNGASTTRCAEQDDKKLLEALRQSKLYRDYERTFTEATGLPLALRPVEFFGLPFHGKKNENPFCAFLAERKSCCALCLQTQGRLNEARAETPYSLQCPYGMTETVVPIVLGERVIGFLCTGQVFTRPTNGAASRSLRLPAEAAGVNAEGLRLWKRTRSMETGTYKATVRLLVFFAKQLSMLSNQLCIEQKAEEPPVISRARQFIAENKGKPITLATVAHASGASMFHFCKLFRATTGVKFTEYVARSRVEDARELLCNRRLRMCEVAYESGFQSLTAFHRAFQRILGQSPTDYRTALGTSGRGLRPI